METFLPRPFSPWIFVVLLALTLPAAVYDFRFRRIPNWLAVTGLLAGIAVNTVLFGTTGLVRALLGMGIALLIYFPLYLLRGMGAGDVKLMAACGAILGVKPWLLLLLFTSISSAAAGFAVAASKGRLRSTLINAGFIARELLSGRSPRVSRKEIDVGNKEAIRMPHGIAAAFAAALLTWLSARFVR